MPNKILDLPLTSRTSYIHYIVSGSKHNILKIVDQTLDSPISSKYIKINRQIQNKIETFIGKKRSKHRKTPSVFPNDIRIFFITSSLANLSVSL